MMFVALRKYATAYYAFIIGVAAGIPIGTLVASYTIRLLLNELV